LPIQNYDRLIHNVIPTCSSNLLMVDTHPALLIGETVTRPIPHCSHLPRKFTLTSAFTLGSMEGRSLAWAFPLVNICENTKGFSGNQLDPRIFKDV